MFNLNLALLTCSTDHIAYCLPQWPMQLLELHLNWPLWSHFRKVMVNLKRNGSLKLRVGSSHSLLLCCILTCRLYLSNSPDCTLLSLLCIFDNCKGAGAASALQGVVLGGAGASPIPHAGTTNSFESYLNCTFITVVLHSFLL